MKSNYKRTNPVVIIRGEGMNHQKELQNALKAYLESRGVVVNETDSDKQKQQNLQCDFTSGRVGPL